MKLKKLLKEVAELKLVHNTAKTKKNESYKCENLKDLNAAIKKLVGDGNRLDIAAILDVNNSIAYIINRTSFHKDMARSWGVPYESSNKDFIILTATYLEGKGIRTRKLEMSEIHQKTLEDLSSGWLKRVFSL